MTFALLEALVRDVSGPHEVGAKAIEAIPVEAPRHPEGLFEVRAFFICDPRRFEDEDRRRPLDPVMDAMGNVLGGARSGVQCSG